MLKKTLAIFALSICGLMNLQAAEAGVSPSSSVEIQQQACRDHLACCGKKRMNGKKSMRIFKRCVACKKKGNNNHLELNLACKRCGNKHAAV